MQIALLIARLVLAVVFLVAGLGKLADLASSRRAVAGFGLPGWLAAPVGTLLPLVEMATAVALIAVGLAWWGGLCALALLTLFIAAVGVSLALGRKPDCHCFGQLHSTPVGAATLARNVLLWVLAAFVVVAGAGNAGASATGWMTRLSSTAWVAIAAGVAVTAQFAIMLPLLLAVLRQNGRLLVRLEALEASLAGHGTPDGNRSPQPAQNGMPGPPIGAAAPDFELEDLDGTIVTLGQLRVAGPPLLLLFTHPDCGPCTALAPEIARWQREHPDAFRTVLISEGTAAANSAKASEHGLVDVLLQRGREVAEAYRVPGTPSAALLTPEGTIAEPLAAGADAIRALVMIARTPDTSGIAVIPPQLKGHANAMRHAPTAAQPGDLAPAFTLPDLSGKATALNEFEGRQTLVLFWDPGCGFCQQMLPALQERDAAEDRPQLLVISRGTVPANAAMGLRSPVLLDDGFAIAARFGVHGTPSALLIDADGKVASSVAVGAESVLNLAGHRRAASAAI